MVERVKLLPPQYSSMSNTESVTTTKSDSHVTTKESVATTKNPWDLMDRYDQAETEEDVQKLFDVIKVENIEQTNEAFKAVHVSQDQKHATGKILAPVVMHTDDGREQELVISLPIVTPNGVEQYKCLYGSENPDEVVDLIMQNCTDAQNNITELFGAEVPLYYKDGQWKINMTMEFRSSSTSAFSSIQNALLKLIFGYNLNNNLYEITQTYQIPEYKKDEMKPISKGETSLTELMC